DAWSLDFGIRRELAEIEFGERQVGSQLAAMKRGQHRDLKQSIVPAFVRLWNSRPPRFRGVNRPKVAEHALRGVSHPFEAVEVQSSQKPNQQSIEFGLVHAVISNRNSGEMIEIHLVGPVADLTGSPPVGSSALGQVWKIDQNDIVFRTEPHGNTVA